MERIVLHIGSHKTGSTAIQGSLLDASEALLRRGILYPRTGRGRPGLNPLAEAIQGNPAPTRSKIHRELVEEARGSSAEAGGGRRGGRAKS